MAVFLFLLAFAVGAFSFLSTALATTAIHQILAACLWIVTAILLVGSVIVATINHRAQDILKQLQAPPSPAGKRD